MFYMIMTNN